VPFALCSVLEAPAFIAGLDDLAVMRQSVEQCGRHLRVAEHGGPFPEGQVCRHDDRGALVKAADQVEQELAAGLGEGEIAEFVQDQEVEAGDQVRGPALSFCPRFGVELVHQVDDVEEPAPAAVSDTGPGDADREMGLSCACAADPHEIALVVKEVTGRQFTDQGLVDFARLEVELVDLLGQRQLGDGHLVFDRAGLLLTDLGGQEVANDLLRFVLSLDRRGDDLVVGCPHAVKLQLAHGVQHL